MLNYRKKTNIDSDIPGQYLKNTKSNIPEITNIEKILNTNGNVEGGDPIQNHGLNQKTVLGVKTDQHEFIQSNQQKNPLTFDQQLQEQLQEQSNSFQSNQFQQFQPNQFQQFQPNQTFQSNQLNPFPINRPFPLNQPSHTNQLHPNQSHQYVINVQQSMDKDAIVVGTNYQKKKFIFYDKNKNFLGAFTVYDFIKYITSNVSANFLVGVDHESTKPIIEKYLCIVKLNNNKHVIQMLNYFESPFVGNIETLIKLYTFIHEFETNELQKLLSGLSAKYPSEAVNVQCIFNQLVHTILNHTLKIIAALTNKISAHDPKTQKIRESLLNYSVGIVYRLSKFIKNEIDTKMNELEIFNQDMLRIEGIRTNIDTKLDLIQKSIDKQNAEIDMIFRNVMMYQMVNQNSTKTNSPPISDLVSNELKLSELGLSDPKLSDPKLSDPKLSDPKLSDPKLNDPKLSDPKLNDPKISESKISESKISEHLKNISKHDTKNTSESMSSTGDMSHIFHLNSESVKTNKIFGTEDNSSHKVREILDELNQSRTRERRLRDQKNQESINKSDNGTLPLSLSDMITQNNNKSFSPGSDNLFSNGENGSEYDDNDNFNNEIDIDRSISGSYLKYLSSTNPTTSNIYNID